MTKSDKAVEEKVQKNTAPESPENGVQANTQFRYTAQGTSVKDATQSTTDSNCNQIHMQSNPQRSPQKKGKEATTT
eukprot:2856457-Ditylum_brightwellii.AAC.1